MPGSPDLRNLMEKVCELHPAERERLERAAARVAELDHPLLNRSFERALRNVFEAPTPGEASRRIDTMEGALTAPGLDGQGRGLRVEPFLRKAALALAAIAGVAFAVGGVLSLLQ